MPAAAKVKSKAGAIAFARHYLEQVSAAWTTPDASLIRDLGADPCEACAFFVKTAVDLQAKGQRYSSTVLRVGKVDSTEIAGNRAIVNLELTQLRSSVVDSSGKVVLTDSAKELKRRVQLGWKAGRWAVEEVSESL